MNTINYEHYFDWAATSVADEEILHTALEESIKVCGNPSSIHSAGRLAREKLEEARERCAKVLGVKAQSLYFTSGGTESDAIPLLSLLYKEARGSVLISAIEHPAIREQALAMKKCGWKVDTVLPGKDGIITADAVAEKIKDDTHLVCIMAVNNETGAIADIYNIADMIMEKSKGRRKIKFHTDCVQAAGKIPLEISHPGIDSAAFSAHKICGPRGIGLLYMPQKVEGFLRGGGQEGGLRSGTENLFGAIAFSLCLERYYINKGNARYEEQKQICYGFIQSLLKCNNCKIIPEQRASLNAQDMAEKYSPWLVQAAFNGIPGQVMLRALDEKGFYISTGSACSAKKADRPILDAMAIPKEISENAVRFSFGPASTKESVQKLAEEVHKISALFS